MNEFHTVDFWNSELRNPQCSNFKDSVLRVGGDREEGRKGLLTMKKRKEKNLSHIIIRKF